MINERTRNKEKRIREYLLGETEMIKKKKRNDEIKKVRVKERDI